MTGSTPLAIAASGTTVVALADGAVITGKAAPGSTVWIDDAKIRSAVVDKSSAPSDLADVPTARRVLLDARGRRNRLRRVKVPGACRRATHIVEEARGTVP